MSTSVLPGLGNQARREAGSWWSTRRWWAQALVWTVLTNALLALVLWVVPRLESLAGTVEAGVEESAVQFAGMAGMLASVGAVVLCQGVLVDERRAGVLEWMLSKPMTREALLAAKFVGQAGGLLVTLVLLPWVGVLVQLTLARGAVWPVGRWAGAVAMVALLVLFHLALVLALSALTWSRAVVVAVPLAGIIGSDLLVATVPGAFSILPWSVARLTGPVLTDGVLAAPGPVLSAVLCLIASLAVAAWCLRRTEL